MNILRRIPLLLLPLALLAGCRDDVLPTQSTPGGPNFLQVEVTYPFSQLTAGELHTCALREDGVVECWGGYIPAHRIVPATKAALDGMSFTQLGSGDNHDCAVRSDGAVECWGVTTSPNAAPPIRTPPSGTKFTQVDAGSAHTCAVRDDGVVECWGGDFSGQAPPTKTPLSGSFEQVTANQFHTCALREDGVVECWGSNSNGRAPPIRTAPTGTSYAQVSAGISHTCALRTPGVVECWGGNQDGQAPPTRTAPSGTSYTQVSAGGTFTCARRSDGVVECWGSNIYGQAPAIRTALSGSFTRVRAGTYHACALRSDHAVECWGLNNTNQAPAIKRSSAGVYVLPIAAFSAVPAPVTAGQSFTLALTGAALPGYPSVTEFSYAFDCGDGFYGAFGSSNSIACTAIGGQLPVRGKVRDQYGDETVYTDLLQVSVPSPPSGTVSLLFWDFQNVTTSGSVSTAIGSAGVDGISGFATQTCGGPAQNQSGIGLVLVTSTFGANNCFPYIQFTLDQPMSLANLTFDHRHLHWRGHPTFPNYKVQLELGTGPGYAYAGVGYRWLLEGDNIYHTGAKAAVIALDLTLEPGTYRIRWVPRDLASGAPNTGTLQWFGLKNVRLNGQPLAPADATPPVITPSITGTQGNNGWYTSNVTVSWTVVDPESGITSPACAPTIISNDTPGQEVSCSATSSGGTASASVTIKRDSTLPVVTVTGVTNGATYPFGSVPPAVCSTTDATSGVATAATLGLSGTGTVTATCSGAVDHAGNTAAPVSATYTVTATLSVATSGSGSVSVSPQQASYTLGEQVTLTATPAAGWSFSGWSGDLSGSTNPATLTMNANRSVTATFIEVVAPVGPILTVSVVGEGTVTSSPAGISCTAGAGTCAASFPRNTRVTLSASPATGWALSGWSGDASSNQGSVEVRMNGDRQVTATFAQPNGPVLSVSANGTVNRPSGAATISGTLSCSSGSHLITVALEQSQRVRGSTTTVSGSGSTTASCGSAWQVTVTPSSPAGSKFAGGAATVTASAANATTVTQAVRLK